MSGFTQIPHGFHKRLRELKGSRLHVWMAHLSREGVNKKSWPSLETLMEDTGYSENAILDARQWLRENGWLVSAGQRHSKTGLFSTPEEHAVIPPLNTEPLPKKCGTVKSSTVPQKVGNGAPQKLGNGRPQKVGNGTVPQKVGIEVDSCTSEVDSKKEEERERSIAPTKVVAAKPSPSPSTSPAAGSKPAQEDQIKAGVNWVIEETKRITNGKAQFGKGAVKDLHVLLQELRDSGMIGINHAATSAAIRAAIRAKAATCKPLDKDPTAWNVFGSQLVADLRPTLIAHEKKAKADAEEAAAQEAWRKWREEFTRLLTDPNTDFETYLTYLTYVALDGVSTEVWHAAYDRYTLCALAQHKDAALNLPPCSVALSLDDIDYQVKQASYRRGERREVFKSPPMESGVNTGVVAAETATVATKSVPECVVCSTPSSSLVDGMCAECVVCSTKGAKS